MWIQVFDEYDELHYINLANITDFYTKDNVTYIHLVSGRMVVCKDNITTSLQKTLLFSDKIVKTVRS